MTADAGFEVLVVALARDEARASRIAIRAEDVREVARVERVTEYPGAPPDVCGVAAVRGQIVPVLDLTPRVGGSQTVVLLAVGARALALAGAFAVRVAAAAAAVPNGGGGAPGPAPPRLWSGRVLPLAGAVRLADAVRPDAADAALPLLDAAALIDEAVDDPDGGS